MPPASIPELIAKRLSDNPTQSIQILTGSAAERIAWGRVVERGLRMARVFRYSAAAEEERVALVGPTSPAMIGAVCGSLLSGVPFTILPPPSRGQGRSQYELGIAERLRVARATTVWVDDLIDPWNQIGGGVRVYPLAALWRASERSTLPQAEPRVTSRPILQFTSGTTRTARAVPIGHDQFVANIEAIAARRELDPGSESFVSWLPLYHDMGLISQLLLPFALGGSVTLLDPTRFVARPALWMGACSQYQATFTAAPSFAFGVAARHSAAEGLDLDRLHTVVNGGEPVSITYLNEFRDTFSGARLRPHALCPSYGLAENTLAVSMPHRGRVACSVAVGPDTIHTSLLGPPVRGTSVEVVSQHGADSSAPGRIVVSGTSATSGYVGDPEEDERVHGEWLETGDLGYLIEGELAVVGRADDVILIGGLKLNPVVVEEAAHACGVRPGAVAAVSLGPDDPRLHVVAEALDADIAAVRRRVRAAVTAAVGVAPEVVIVENGTIPKTSSGKLQRHLVRDRLRGGLWPE